ncbi:predicted protein [Naegleria gruberi]|uniref:Predicted protein n=1 Tax=Naegleria gruberi TaxID=5762 RepID=D2VBK7_NAEGR|nr:uncharacterized protein NAEGRDRAFT_48227 [Naegleria gruberi]EFC45813.1 predicted protein [Naegleria gruberi]|eukprot:XP_002678557.1 predicted protein [Naegleria gruberi strain NEG-M]
MCNQPKINESNYLAHRHWKLNEKNSMRTILVLLALCVLALAVNGADISFISSFDDYKLSCNLKTKNNTVNPISSGYLVGLYAEGGSSYRLAMIDLDSNAITYIGNDVFNSYSLGGVAIDPINHRLFIMVVPSQTPTMRTYSLLTGKMLYQVNTSEISNLVFEPALGNLYGLGYNDSMVTILDIDWETGEDTIVATTPLKGSTNMIRNINPATSVMYIYGYDSTYFNTMIAVNLTSGSWKYFNPPSITSYVALFSNGYQGKSNVLAIAEYEGKYAPVSIDSNTNVTVIGSTRFNSLVLSDKAYDVKENVIIGTLEDTSKIVVLNMTSGLIVKQIPLNSGASLGPVSYQQICVCCIASQNTRSIYGGSLDKSIVLPCQTNTASSTKVIGTTSSNGTIKPSQSRVSSSNSNFNISLVFIVIVGFLMGLF